MTALDPAQRPFSVTATQVPLPDFDNYRAARSTGSPWSAATW
ncbi:hypothetical protein ACPZ19_12015 [Amycolatopsis lurida]